MVIPLAAPGRLPPDLRDAVDAAIRGVLDRGIMLLGPATETFEAGFARYLGADHCVAVANGTDALELALRAVDVLSGQEVVTVANAGGYSTSACLQVGAVPVYVDVDATSLTMDLDAAVRACGSQTGAVIVTHLFGWPVDVPRLRYDLDKAGFSGLPIIEDCAQGHGASIGDRRVGTMGLVAAFSFYPTKNLGAMGDAGAVVTSDPAVARRTRMLRQYGWDERYRQELGGGRNSRMDEIQAAVLTVMLERLDGWNERRRMIASEYSAVLAGSSYALFVHDVTEPGYVAHLAVVRAEERSAAIEHLSRQGVATSVHYPVLDVDQRPLRVASHRVLGDLKISRAASREILSVPCFPTMTHSEVGRVGAALAGIPGPRGGC